MKGTKNLSTDTKTLTTTLNKLVEEGYTEDFKATEKGLMSLKTQRVYSPSQFQVVDFFRFEGASDPADSSILYAIETMDGKKGTLTDAYGPYADANVTQLMKEVEDLSKNPT